MARGNVKLESFVYGVMQNQGITSDYGAGFGGDVAVDGAITGAKSVSIDSSSATPTLGSSGSVNIASRNTGTQTYTLPSAASNPGATYTFICGNASGEILINPQTSEKIVTMTWAAIGADADTGQISNTTTGIKNTAATNVVGDSITLVSNGVDTWFGLGMPTGIWATQ